MDDQVQLTARKTGFVVPVSAEQLLDAGLPLPDGMEPPVPPARPSLYRRCRWAVSDAVHRVRERVGFWIAGHTPDDWSW
jgi:hypothetical protein